jgi:PAS domain S-box-containing protein
MSRQANRPAPPPVRERKSDLRRKAERRLSARRTPRAAADKGGGPELLHELRVHQVELELQNEELRRAQEELEASRSKFYDLYDLAPVGYFALDRHGQVAEANTVGARMLGLAKTKAAGKPLSRFILRADQGIFFQNLRLLAETGAARSFELRLAENGNTATPRWVRLDVNAAAPRDGSSPVLRVAMSDITERHRAEELRESLEEKEILLREVHHRVKNNLSAVIGLIQLQQAARESWPTEAALADLENRIRSMALVHELLYQSKRISRLDLGVYLRTLAERLQSFLDPQQKIRIRVDAAPVETDLDTAVPCGLVADELLTNSFRHAFPADRPAGEDPEVFVTLARRGEECVLTVGDNGVGLPRDLDVRRVDSLGLRIVFLLSEYQLRGRISRVETGGTVFRLRFHPLREEE